MMQDRWPNYEVEIVTFNSQKLADEAAEFLNDAGIPYASIGYRIMARVHRRCVPAGHPAIYDSDPQRLDHYGQLGIAVSTRGGLQWPIGTRLPLQGDPGRADGGGGQRPHHPGVLPGRRLPADLRVHARPLRCSTAPPLTSRSSPRPSHDARWKPQQPGAQLPHRPDAAGPHVRHPHPGPDKRR